MYKNHSTSQVFSCTCNFFWAKCRSLMCKILIKYTCLLLINRNSVHNSTTTKKLFMSMLRNRTKMVLFSRLKFNKILIKDEIEYLQNKLRVDTKKTNSFYRSHHSASDKRTSAFSTGLVGIVLLCIPIFLFVSIDFMNFFRR